MAILSHAKTKRNAQKPRPRPRRIYGYYVKRDVVKYATTPWLVGWGVDTDVRSLPTVTNIPT